MSLALATTGLAVVMAALTGAVVSLLVWPDSPAGRRLSYGCVVLAMAGLGLSLWLVVLGPS